MHLEWYCFLSQKLIVSVAFRENQLRVQMRLTPERIVSTMFYFIYRLTYYATFPFYTIIFFEPTACKSPVLNLA